jgi:hypothetical protein
MNCNRRVFFAKSLAVLLFVLAVAFPAGADEVSVPMPKTDLSIIRGIDDCAQFTGGDIRFLSGPGEPALPYRQFTVLLPPDAVLSTVKASLSGYAEETLPGVWDVPPQPPIQAWQDDRLVDVWPAGKHYVDGRDRAVYGENAVFPALAVGRVASGQLRMYKLATVPVCLARYNPQTKKLTRLDGGKIVVQFNRDPGLWSRTKADFNSPDPIGEGQVKEIALNYADMASAYALPAPAAPTKAPAYVIITTNAIRAEAVSSAAIDAFKADKELKGFTVYIATESNWGGGTGDTAANNIRSWLQTCYGPSRSNVKYVLIIGDANPRPGMSLVPMKWLWPAGYVSPDPDPKKDLERGVPTDYYYADLTGNWDLNGNGYAGEGPTDADPPDLRDYGPGGVDVIAEVKVGRIAYPGGAPNDLKTILEKTITYNNETPLQALWRRNVLIPIHPLCGAGHSDPSDPAKVLAEHMADTTYQSGEMIKNTLLIPNDWPYHRIYELGYGLVPPPETIDCSVDSVTNEWKSTPYGLVFWVTHGGRWHGEEVMDQDPSHLGSLNSAYPCFAFQGSCGNACAEAPDNLAYAMLKKAAVTTIAATRSWVFRTQYPLDYFHELLALHSTAGEAFFAMQKAETNFILNLFGDPSATLYAPLPYSLTPGSRTHYFNADTGTIDITADPSFAWTATTAAGWITITSGGSGTGNGRVTYSVDANPAKIGREGIITIGRSSFRVRQSAFVEIPQISEMFDDVARPSLAWGDYDNDGYLDLLLTGTATTGAVAKIYKNNGPDGGGSVSFTDSGAVFDGIGFGTTVWGDFNNDGYLDILMNVNNGTNMVTRLYRNDPAAAGPGRTFTRIDSGLPDLELCSAAWGDYDNDGDLDLILQGKDAAGDVTKIFRNDGRGPGADQWIFTDSLIALNQLSRGTASWADYDNDGDLDLLVTGAISDGPGTFAALYRNDGAAAGGWIFTPAPSGIVGVDRSSIAWADYDNDGFCDVLVTGMKYGSGPSTVLYHNVPLSTSSRTFAPVTAAFLKVNEGTAVWGDYDNDGDPDILLSGLSSPGTHGTRLYRNDGASGPSGWTFTDVDPGFTNVFYSAAAWGDCDNDGDLDVVISGRLFNFMDGLDFRYYQNISPVADTLPSSPKGLTSVVSGRDVTLAWNPSSDTQTPSAGLNYNLMVGTTSRGVDIVSPHSDPLTGYRRVVAIGNAGQSTSRTLKGLPGGRYQWSVQSIDTTYAGSGFNSLAVFEIGPTISGIVTDGGAPLAGAQLNGLPGTPVTAADGTYSVAVPYRWSGTVTPYKSGYYFGPANRVYSVVTKDMAGQNYARVAAALRAQYYNSSDAPINNTIFTRVRIFNDGTTNVDIKDITVKYWYANDGVTPEAVDIDYAGEMSSGRYIKPNTHTVLTALSPERAGQNRALTVTFDAGAGALRPSTVKDSYVQAHLRVHKDDYRMNYNQANDYSYGDHDWYKDWPKVAVYYKGVIVWGSEP